MSIIQATPIFQITFDNTETRKVYQPTYTARLEAIVFCNSDVSAQTVSIYHDIDGDTFDDNSMILSLESIAAGDRYVFTDRLLLNSSGWLAVDVSAADVVSATGYAWVEVDD